MNSHACGPNLVHSPCSGGALPTDISISSGTELKLYSNAEVRSFIVERLDSCAPGCPEEALRNAILVRLFYQPNFLVEFGWVLFGHIAPPVLSAQGYNRRPSGDRIGYVPGGTCADYYTGPHSHMEAMNKFGWLSRGPYGCDNWVTAASTTIYQWDFEDIG